MPNNSLVEAKGSGTISFYVYRTNAKPGNIVLQHVLYVTACATNNLFSIIELLWKGVNFDLTLDGATASLGSVHIYDAPIMTSMFVLGTSTTSASGLKATVVVHDQLSSTPSATSSTTPSSTSSSAPKLFESYSNIEHAVDEMNILVWYARLGRLSLAAVTRLPNTVKGIRLHPKRPLTSTCEATIIDTMLLKPFLSVGLDDNGKTQLLESFHSDVVGAM